MDLTLWYLTHNNPLQVPYKYGYHKGDTCPKCGARCQDWSEYVDVGVGYQQVTYHMECLVCGAEGRNSGQDVVWLEPCEESEHGMKILGGENMSAATIREQYPEGTRIELIQMGEDPHPVEPGMRGSVSHVDDAGQIHMEWDNGRTLALNTEEDQFTIITDGKVNFRGVLLKIFERRVKQAERQSDKYYYEMRHGDDDWSEPYEIKRGILVNFWGTLEADQELTLDEQGFITLTQEEIDFIVMNAQ